MQSPSKKSKTEEKQSPKLHVELQAKLEAYRKKRNFDAKSWVDKKVGMFNEYMSKCRLSAAVVSLSGGVDSAVTLGLMKRALDAKNSPLKRIMGIAQPIHSSEWALNRARECAKDMGVELITVDQTEQHTRLCDIVEKASGIAGEPFATGQLRSYMRTPVGYYVAQLLSQKGTPCVVLGTGNQDEDGYLAYFCKAGDGVVDIQLIADLHKSEVFKVGAEVGVPKSILVAAPSADLWPGQTDEDELGFTYDFIELYTGDYLKRDDSERKSFVESLGSDARKQFDEWSTSCTRVHERNKHKLNGPINLNVLKASSAL